MPQTVISIANRLVLSGLTLPLLIGVSVILLTLLFFYIKQERSRRWRIEGVLRQQRERERLVAQIAQHIRQSLDLHQVLTTAVAEVQQFLQADRVLIYRLWPDGSGCAINETVLPPFPRILGQSFPEEVFPREYHQAYALGQVRAIGDVDQAQIEDCLVDFVRQFGVRAKLVVPILQEHHDMPTEGKTTPDATSDEPVPHLWGLLIAHQCSGPRRWKNWEIELMQQLATQVAIAVQQSELYAQLQQLNAELELRVQQRTEELAQTNRSLQSEIVERQRTEAALRQTNYTLQALITASPRAIFTIDLEGRVQIWNPAATEMFGWSEGEVVGQLNPIFKDDPEYHELCRKVWQGAIYPRVELCRFKKSGTPIDIVFSAAPLQDSEGRINGLVAVMADITEHKQQEEQVRLLQSVVLNTNDAVVITEAEPIEGQGPRILYVNEAFTRISGYRPEEVLGKTPRILQGPNTDRRALDKVRTALACWQPATVEVINYRKDGTEFWNEFSIVPVADKAGWYTHWIAVQRDTTERKAVEQALRQSEERFRSLIENALDIITILDPDGIIHYESPSVEKVLGYRVAELIGTGFFDNIHPDDCAKTALSLNRTLQEAAAPLSSPIEFRCKHQDGSWRVLEAIAQTFVDNAAPRIIVNSRDITERKRLDEIRLALEQEKELGELKTRFFSMASHEFRTPLSTALAAAQLLENSQDAWDDTAKRMRNLHRIQDALKQIAQLLDDILMINRAETGKLEFNPKPIALEPFCRHFVEEMRLSAGPNHALHFTCHGQPAVLPHLDERLLRSILANLLSNAIKYSPKGGVVHLSLEFQLQRILLKVEDQGIGIQVTDQAQLFAPFQRGKNVASIPGTGLGLVVVKKCVDLHQGSVTISSTVDRGTTCIVSLPVLVP